MLVGKASHCEGKERFVHARHLRNRHGGRQEEIRESLSTYWSTYRHVCGSLLSD